MFYSNFFWCLGSIPSSTTNTSTPQFSLGGSSVTTSLSLNPIVSSSASSIGFQLGSAAPSYSIGKWIDNEDDSFILL